MREYKLEDFCDAELSLVIQKLTWPVYQMVHRHNAVELVYIKHGAGWCAVNEIVYPMLTGDLYILPVGATHEFFCEKNLSYVNILFNESIFQEQEMPLFHIFSGTSANKMLDKYTFGPNLQPKIMSRIDEVEAELQSKEPFHVQRCRALFIELLVFIFRNANFNFAPGIHASHAQKQMGRVLSYITDHLDSKLSLKVLAEISGYKPDYFGKLFRKEIGSGVAEYIYNRRIELACFYLENTTKTIDEIATGTGFFDASYFIKTFKRCCGMTPFQYRRTHQKGLKSSNQ